MHPIHHMHPIHLIHTYIASISYIHRMHVSHPTHAFIPSNAYIHPIHRIYLMHHTHTHVHPHTSIHVLAEAGCLNNGSSDAIGGLSIYFGPGDHRNICVVPICEECTSTNNRSHLHSLLRSIIICMETCNASPPIYIKTCSKITVWYSLSTCLTVMHV